MDEKNDDNTPDPLKGLFSGGAELLAHVLGALLGGSIEDPYESLSDEEKILTKKVEAHWRKRIDDLQAGCFGKGCTAVAYAKNLVTVSTYGGMEVYDAHTCKAGDMLRNVCITANTIRMNFAPDSDQEIYTVEQLRPTGISPSILAMVHPVKKVMPAMFAGAFEKPSETVEQKILNRLIDGIMLEFYQVVSKSRTAHGDHFHYDMELLCRTEFTQDFCMGNDTFTFPALPISNEDALDFYASLEFMDENPESGG